MPKTEKEVSIEDRVTAMESKLTEFAEWRRKVSANWKRFVQTGAVGPEMIEKGSDGKLKGGYSLVRMLAATGLGLAVVCGVAFAVSQIGDPTPDKANWGTAAIRADGTFAGDGGISVTGNVTVTSNLVIGGSATIGGVVLSPTNGVNLAGTNQVQTIISNSTTYVTSTNAQSVANTAYTATTNGISCVLTNASWNGGVITGNLTFVNGRLTNRNP